jgi:hypothetical protein
MRAIIQVFSIVMFLISTRTYGQVKDSVINANIELPRKSESSIFDLRDEQLNNHHRHLRYSVLSGYIEGLPPTRKGMVNFETYQNVSNGTTKISMVNLSREDLLTLGFYSEDQVVFQVKERDRYRFTPGLETKSEWLRKNALCFEFLYPQATMRNGNILTQEIEKYLNVKTEVKKILADVYVLTRTSNKDKLKSKGRNKSKYDRLGNINNLPINTLRTIFSQLNLPELIDKTDYPGNVDLQLNIQNWNDLETIVKSLRRYDLNLTLEKSESQKFVISDVINDRN